MMMAGPEGLEPSTCRLEVGCSIQLSYGPATARCSASGRGREEVAHDKLRMGLKFRLKAHAS